MLTFQELMLVSNARLHYIAQTRLHYIGQTRLDQIRLDYTIQVRLDQTRLHYIAQTRLDQTTLYSLDQTTLYSLDQTTLILAIYAHILGSLCSHFRNISWCLISFYLLLASFQQSMLTFGFCQEVCAHILGTYVGLSSHFTSSQPHFSNLCSHFRNIILVSHLILASFLAIYAHILGSLCSHFRKICWSLISFYLLLASFQQSMLTFGFCQEVCAHILGRYVGLSSHFTSSQPHFSNLCSHLGSVRKSVLTFQEDMLVSHLILPPLSLILAIYAHILGTYVGLSSHFSLIFSNLCSHLGSVRKSVLTFQEHILVSHLILPPLSLILAIYAHIWVLLGSLCSHFRNISWSLISFYLLLASFQQSMLTFGFCQEVCAHILGTYVGLSSHFTSSQPHFSNLCSHFRKSVLTFQEHMLISHLILPPLSLILAIYAHILGTYVGLSSHFSLILAIYAHIWVLLVSLCSHFRNICWSLISFYLLLASFQQSMITFGFCQEVCAHILGTYVGLSSHFTSCQPHFSNLCSHFRNICWSLISFQPHFSNLCSHFRNICWSLISFQPHFSNLCSHFRNICWSLISFYLLLALFQQSMLTFYLGDKHFSPFPSHFSWISFLHFFCRIGRVSHLMSSLLHARMHACLMLTTFTFQHMSSFLHFLAKLVVFPT